MQKVFLIFLGLLALGNAASLFANEDPVTTAAAEGTTVAAGETTVGPKETTVAAGETTVGAGETTVGPKETTEGPKETTVAAGETTVAAGETTVSPKETTVGPKDTTVAAGETTNKPEGTTVAPGGTTVAPVPGKCVYPTQTWGVPDLRKFEFCLDGVARETSCNEDEYYVSNAEISGCVPADEMSPECVNLDVTVGPCSGKNVMQPQPSESLTSFYFCQKAGEEPVEVQCAEGTAFLKKDGYMGCFKWPEWRQIRGCQTYTNSP